MRESATAQTASSRPLTIFEFWLDGTPVSAFVDVEPVSMGEACAAAVTALDGVQPLTLDSIIAVASTESFEGDTMTVERTLRWIEAHGDGHSRPRRAIRGGWARAPLVGAVIAGRNSPDRQEPRISACDAGAVGMTCPGCGRASDGQLRSCPPPVVVRCAAGRGLGDRHIDSETRL